MNCDMNSSNSIAPMNYFEKLPEGCISEIISRTTPTDAIKSIILSKGFKVAAESDEIWRKFLPFDHQEIINRCEFPPICNTKKELFFSLCDSPILLDGDKLSFCLDKHSGKKCFMIAPRNLTIYGSDKTYVWQWDSHPNSRFSEVAQLQRICWLEIEGKIENRLLSKGTKYVVYLIFKLEDNSFGLDGIAGTFVTNVDSHETSIMSLSGRGSSGNQPSIRGDGWMEVEIGNFFNVGVEDGDVEVGFMEISTHVKSGLIVEGIEFRPE